MPDGHADYAGSSAGAKPNTNVEGQLDLAADLEVNPDEIAPENVEVSRANAAPENETATERLENPEKSND